MRQKKFIVFILLLAWQFADAQVRPYDFKGIGSVYYFGVVYNGAQIVGADKGHEAYKGLFTAVNDHYAQNPEELEYVLKKGFKLGLEGTDVSFAEARNSTIDEFSLFSYKPHNESCNYQELQTKLKALRIPANQGYGLILFCYLIDQSERLYEYDIVFFNRQNNRIIAHASGNATSKNEGGLWEIKESVIEALMDYND